MESIAILDSVQFEKAKGMLCYKLLCLVEVLGAVVILCWCSSRLPLALLFFRSFLAGHVFCFIVSNVIIITLLANSLSSPPAADSESDLYAEITADMSASISEIHAAVPFQDKEMIPEVPVAAGDGVAHETPDFDFPKAFRRSKSAKYYCSEKSVANKGAVLRRSETKTYCREVVKEEEEEMSNEEFQRTIEEFIAKQLKFRRQESISGVVS